jgi:hypothetical protein
MKSPSQPRKYLTEDEIALIVVSELSDADRETLLDTPREHLIKFHMSVGMGIRNRFGLWEEANPFTDASDPMDDFHPDQMSQRIIEKVWRKVCAAEGVNYTNERS